MILKPFQPKVSKIFMEIKSIQLQCQQNCFDSVQEFCRSLRIKDGKIPEQTVPRGSVWEWPFRWAIS